MTTSRFEPILATPKEIAEAQRLRKIRLEGDRDEGDAEKEKNAIAQLLAATTSGELQGLEKSAQSNDAHARQLRIVDGFVRKVAADRGIAIAPNATTTDIARQVVDLLLLNSGARPIG